MIGAGGFAKPVAIKLLNADMEGLEEVAQRMRDEARMLGLLRHRAIVQVDGLVMLDGRWAIVMEFVQGVDLSTVVSHTRVPASPALEIIEEVAGALHVAYDKPTASGKALRVLHRDIKPQNIQLTAAGEVKVLDFGIARAEFANREAETRNMLFGSALYMAPERMDMIEQHEGDIYSLGVVLYELLTATQFGKAQASPKRHDKQVLVAIDTLNNVGTHQDIIDLVLHMTQYEPEDRPSAKEVSKRVRSLGRAAGGEALVDWSEHHVPTMTSTAIPESDELSGKILRETTTGSIVPTTAPKTAPAQDTIALDTGEMTPPVSSQPIFTEAWQNPDMPAEAPAPAALQPEPAPEPTPVPPAVEPEPAPQPALTEPEPPPDTGADETGPYTTGPFATGTAAKVGLAGGAAVTLAGGALVFGLVLAVIAAVVFWPPADEPEDSIPDVVEVEDTDDEPEVVDVDTEDEPVVEAKKHTGAKKVASDVAEPETEDEPAAEAEAVSAESSCGGQAVLEPLARFGNLNGPQQTCLKTYADDASRPLVDRRKMGVLLLVHYQVECSEGRSCAGYESYQPWYFEELDRSDPTMMLAWVTHLAKQKSSSVAHNKEIVKWAERGLDRKSAWSSMEYVRNVDKLYEYRARASYKIWEVELAADSSSAKKSANRARIASVDWMNNRLDLGKDASAPRQLCNSVTGASEVCQRQSHDANAKVVMTFVSAPLGAEIFIDNASIGKTPKNHEMKHGDYSLRMVLPDGTSGSQNIGVETRNPTRYVWKSTTNQWITGY